MGLERLIFSIFYMGGLLLLFGFLCFFYSVLDSGGYLIFLAITSRI